MKTYLNAQGQKDVLMIHAMRTTANSLISEMQAPKAVIGDLKRADYFLGRAVGTRINEFGPDIVDKLERQRKILYVMIANNAAAKAERKAFYRFQKEARQEEYRENGPDRIYDMAEALLDNVCKTCDGRKRPKCGFYEAFLEYDIEAWYPGHEHCQYAGTGSDKR